MDPLLQTGATALRKAALNEKAKEFILNNEVVFSTFKRAADRYIGGETLEETIPKVIKQNENGLKCSIEFMGESTYAEQEANMATEEFIRICQEIRRLGLNSTVSLDLSHIGLAISKELGYKNLELICKEAKEGDIEVIISAEDVHRTDAIIDAYKKISREFDNVAITLQAYLYRTKDDFKDLINESGRIRMVKGAFDVPANLAWPRGEQLDEAYLGYVDQLLSLGHKCSIATHHNKIQQKARELISMHQPERNTYEFESLYGIRTEQLMALKDEGYPAKLYFVYGKEWYLYVCNRIAEYPLNIFQALNDIVG
ncbi:proline oxidase [Fulvivirga imtechensis AK7]|uniref:proline dehydrogenase n=1 Tax=Fulvivirga imtechensis AK7 TaxID=1237149 RepID=L8JJN3_9BACT|nr:proline dehydrogenase family protein [Fulvivirga imtechensis]ELR69015.1 proline oxidase [Fulvivirga imtechensis AK7]